MDNYEFCADLCASKGGRILDFGCGKGQIVELLQARGAEAFGCDVFFDGGSYRDMVPAQLIDSGVIRQMEGTAVPFPDEYFDVVVNNQVMEHVPDLDATLREIARVLRPGGSLLSLFPSKDVWREGHCGVAFAHWWPKGSSARNRYMAFFRALGFGYHPQITDRAQWVREVCTYLDDWTHYRSYRELRAAFGRYFEQPQHVEDVWLDARLGNLPAPRAAKRLFVRKMAGLVFWCRKPKHGLALSPRH